MVFDIMIKIKQHQILLYINYSNLLYIVGRNQVTRDAMEKLQEALSSKALFQKHYLVCLYFTLYLIIWATTGIALID